MGGGGVAGGRNSGERSGRCVSFQLEPRQVSRAERLAKFEASADFGGKRESARASSSFQFDRASTVLDELMLIPDTSMKRFNMEISESARPALTVSL